MPFHFAIPFKDCPFTMVEKFPPAYNSLLYKIVAVTFAPETAVNPLPTESKMALFHWAMLLHSLVFTVSNCPDI